MTDPSADLPTDARASRTREALFRAFFGLVLQQRYDAIRLGDILARAGVARSTFYAHFPDKDALLVESLRHPFAVLADLIVSPETPPRLAAVLQHFADNRQLALALLQSAKRRHAERALVGLVEQRWKSSGLSHGCVLAPALASHQIAQAILAPLQIWLQSPAGVDADTLAHGLHRSIRGLVAGLEDTRL